MVPMKVMWLGSGSLAVSYFCILQLDNLCLEFIPDHTRMERLVVNDRGKFINMGIRGDTEVTLIQKFNQNYNSQKKYIVL